MDGKISDITARLFANEKYRNRIVSKMKASESIVGEKFKLGNKKYTITNGSLESFDKRIKELQERIYEHSAR